MQNQIHGKQKQYTMIMQKSIEITHWIQRLKSNHKNEREAHNTTIATAQPAGHISD